MPFVGQAEGKGVYERYRSVLSNFATLNRVTEDNATGRLRGLIISQRCYTVMSSELSCIITWRGLAALLILNTGQCEGLIVGMSEKLESPMPFLFPYLTK